MKKALPLLVFLLAIGAIVVKHDIISRKIVTMYYLHKLGSQNNYVAAKYEEKLKAMGNRAIPILKVALETDNEDNNAEAIQILAVINTPESTKLLKDYLRYMVCKVIMEHQTMVRAANSVVARGDSDPIPFLIYAAGTKFPIGTIIRNEAIHTLNKESGETVGRDYDRNASGEKQLETIDRYWVWWNKAYYENWR